MKTCGFQKHFKVLLYAVENSCNAVKLVSAVFSIGFNSAKWFNLRFGLREIGLYLVRVFYLSKRL